MSPVQILAEPSPLMRSIVTNAERTVLAMLQDCREHGLQLHEFAMHIEIGTKSTPQVGVPAMYVDARGTIVTDVSLFRDDVVRVAPMPFAGFRAMPPKQTRNPFLEAVMEVEGKRPNDLVVVCTDVNLRTAFVGYAMEDFGLSEMPTSEDLVATAMPHGVPHEPRHITNARLTAANALVGLSSEQASAVLHGNVPSEAMTKARRLAGSDWPEVEDAISHLLCFGTPIAWGDLLPRLSREKTRHGFWWLGAHGEHPAGTAFVVQNPSKREAESCLLGGMVGEWWTAETAPNSTLGKRITPGTTTYVWYADEAFAAAEAAEAKMRSPG